MLNVLKTFYLLFDFLAEEQIQTSSSVKHLPSMLRQLGSKMNFHKQSINILDLLLLMIIKRALDEISLGATRKASVRPLFLPKIRKKNINKTRQIGIVNHNVNSSMLL